MDNYDDLLSDGHIPGAPVPSGEFNSVVRILDMQVPGALEGVGEGVIGENDWLVTAGVGLSVDIAAGAGVVDSTHGFCFYRTSGASNLAALPPNSTVYVYATAVFRVAPADPDSREDGSVSFTWNLVGGAVADSILLAHFDTDGVGVSGDITDDRTFIRGTEALLTIADNTADLTEIREAIGLDYFGGAPPAASLDARVDDLEAEGTESAFWGDMHKGAGDATTVDQQIDADVQAHVDEYHQGEQDFYAAPEMWDEDSVNQAKGVIKLVRSVDPEHALHFIDSVVVVWAHWGDGTAGSPDYVDTVNSTWVP